MYRSISVTALAAFIALGTQGAFADAATPDAAPITAPTAVEATAHAGQAGERAASANSVSVTSPARTRPAARIPGTFAITGSETSRDGYAREEQFRLHVLLPALSGDGGG